MQTDLPSSLPEEKQPEPSSMQGMTQSESPSTLEAAQTESIPADETSKLNPSPFAEKKNSKFNKAAALRRLFLVILTAAVVGLGYWAYALNAKLVETRQQLSTLQGKHDKLQIAYTTLTSANGKLTTDLAQSKADLEKANVDLTASQNDLKKWQTRNKDLDIKIDTASKLTEILYAWTTADEASDILEINFLIEESGDEFLIKQWEDLGRSRSEDDFNRFLSYLVRAIRTSLQ